MSRYERFKSFSLGFLCFIVLAIATYMIIVVITSYFRVIHEKWEPQVSAIENMRQVFQP